MNVGELIAFLQKQDSAAVVVLPLPAYWSEDPRSVFTFTDMQADAKAVQLRITRKLLSL